MSAEPERKQSRPIIDIKNNNNPANSMALTKPKVEMKLKGPIDPAKMNEVKEALTDLEGLINTYE